MESVITKNVEPYSIVAGNPARIIRYRFEKEVIDELLKIKWWSWDDKIIEERKKRLSRYKSFC